MHRVLQALKVDGPVGWEEPGATAKDSELLY